MIFRTSSPSTSQGIRTNHFKLIYHYKCVSLFFKVLLTPERSDHFLLYPLRLSYRNQAKEREIHTRVDPANQVGQEVTCQVEEDGNEQGAGSAQDEGNLGNLDLVLNLAEPRVLGELLVELAVVLA